MVAGFLVVLSNSVSFPTVSSTYAEQVQPKPEVSAKLRQTLNRTPAAYLQVKGRAVSKPSALDPAIAALNLSIPAVLRIVGHLMEQVLAEAQAGGGDPNLYHEEVGPPDEVGKSLVGDDLLLYGLPQAHRLCLLRLTHLKRP